ncbi:helix-turn-helix transcriptional regulator [Haloarcula onubensis]|uniref:DUF4897 domain-containing protein n=1 Tax=Haloarcula onubensis TaxID=2950539 RepID=A0ABU2FQJ8_9EURY|nr:hypothetical protein [Halomicroarcula sp. S3CR25-11]MDS0282551.1 hypothetical protein [Halomicroarcula sp. S3CR25-11]
MRRVSAVLAVVVLAALTPTAAAGAFGGLSQQSVDADVVVMTADVTATGDAAWAIDYRVRLADDDETRAFEELRADIRGNESVYADRFRDRMNRAARAGENATGREMAIDNVSVETSRESVGQSYGVVTYEFRWTNFAAVNDTHIRAGDAVAGLYLDRNTSLTMRWPASHRRVAVRPSPDEASDRSVTWRGRQSFADDEPRVVAKAYPPLGDSAVQTSLLPALVALLAVLAGGYGVYRYVRADDGGRDDAEAATVSDGDDAPSDDSESTDTAAETPPAELLSNEEQVRKLLRENGGRIKQQRVASELDWTAAKTSQVVGGLREDGDVETFRIGRENVVTFPDTDLTDGGDADDDADDTR